MMYQEKVLTEDQFVSRLCNLPMMSAAIVQLNSLYSKTKERNRLLRFTMETAEAGVAIAVNTAKPVVAKFETQINALNGIACTQLDKLESCYLIITKPGDEVVKETKDCCSSVLHPFVSRVASVKQYGVDKVTDAKNYTTEKMTNVKSYGVGKVMAVTEIGSKQVTRALNTPVGHGVMTRMDVAFDLVDRYVDRYLPEENDSDLSLCTEKQVSDNNLVLKKACRLGHKVRSRVYVNLACRVRSVQKRSKDTLDRLNFTLDLIQQVRENVAGAREKIGLLWEEVNKPEEMVVNETIEGNLSYENLTFERKAIATARHLTQRLKSILSFVYYPASAVSDVLRQKTVQVQEMVHSLVSTFSEKTLTIHGLPQSALDNARNMTKQIELSMNWFIQYSLATRPVAYILPTLSKVMGLPDPTEPNEDPTDPLSKFLNANPELNDADHDEEEQEIFPNLIDDPSEDPHN